MRKVIRALEVMEKELSGRPFIVADEVTMAAYFLLPTQFAFAVAPEGKQSLPNLFRPSLAGQPDGRTTSGRAA